MGVHVRYAKLKRVILTLKKGFICERFVEAIKRIIEPAEELTFYDQLELVQSFCYFGDRLNASGGNEAVVTVRTRMGCIAFRECGEMPNESQPLLKIKGEIYHSCVRLAKLYVSGE